MVVLSLGRNAAGVLNAVLKSLVRLYQATLAPWLGHHCRYQPTCSNYALEALERHGPLRGSYLAVQRLLRCHPWARGGPDPVPGSGGSSGVPRGEN